MEKILILRAAAGEVQVETAKAYKDVLIRSKYETRSEVRE